MVPERKVTAGALAGALSVILIYIIQTAFEVVIPAEVASAGTVVLTFITSYLVPNAA